MSELERARLELKTYEQEVQDGVIRSDPAYRRALLMRIDMLEESEKSEPDVRQER